jgi:hypothetical protein
MLLSTNSGITTSSMRGSGMRFYMGAVESFILKTNTHTRHYTVRGRHHVVDQVVLSCNGKMTSKDTRWSVVSRALSTTLR